MLTFLKSLFGARSETATPDVPPDIVMPTHLRETSMNFDTENVGPFFHRLNAKTTLTVTEDFIADVLVDLPDIAVNNSKSFETMIATADGPKPMRLNIFMDDIDAPDLYFFASEDVIEQMDQALQDFAAENGL